MPKSSKVCWKYRTRKRSAILETLYRKSLIYSGFPSIINNWITFSSLHQFSPFSEVHFRADVEDKCTEEYSSGLRGSTRNALGRLNGAWVRPPPPPPERPAHKRLPPFVGFLCTRRTRLWYAALLMRLLLKHRSVRLSLHQQMTTWNYSPDGHTHLP